MVSDFKTLIDPTWGGESVSLQQFKVAFCEAKIPIPEDRKISREIANAAAKLCSDSNKEDEACKQKDILALISEKKI